MMEECERLSHAVHDQIARLMLLANQDAQRVALRTSARTSRLVMAGDGWCGLFNPFPSRVVPFTRIHKYPSHGCHHLGRF